MALQVSADKRVGIIYFGTKLTNASEYQYTPTMQRPGDDYSGILNSAYTPSGLRYLVEPAVRVTHANGNTSLDLQYVSHQVQKPDNNVSTTSILLRDPAYALDVTLFYKVNAQEDIIEQWSVIKNHEKGNVTLRK